MRRASPYRYLAPGLVGIAVLALLPMLYTVWLGFTNYSAAHLLTFERATEAMLGETFQASSTRYQFSLHSDGVAFRIILRTSDDDTATDNPVNVADRSAFVSPPLPLIAAIKARIVVAPLAGARFVPGAALPLREISARADAIRALTFELPGGTTAAMSGLREMSPYEPLYQKNADGTLTNRRDHVRLTADFATGFYETPDGKPAQPGFRTSVGFHNYVQVFTEDKFRGPFLRVFAWTLAFAALTVALCTGLGLLLAELLTWEGLRFAAAYRVLLFLPYAVPSFISILVFKGLFNHNFGEINRILDSVIGIRPDWTGNAWLARLMILIVNVWLGYPYFMLLGMGLQKSIPRDLYEASAIAGAGPVTNFVHITWPLIRKPLMPLIVSAFAFNFNNFVLIFLLTAGRPDFLATHVPAGETDILVSYTYRIAFQDSGQNIGLAAAISTVIFAMVAILSVIHLRMTRAVDPDRSSPWRA